MLTFGVSDFWKNTMKCGKESGVGKSEMLNSIISINHPDINE